MRIPSPTAALARRPTAYALSDLGACTWYLLPIDSRQAAADAGHAHAFDSHPIFRCRLVGRYAAGLSLNAVCGNGYATVHQLAESHVDAVSRLRVRDALNDAEHRVHTFDDGIDWQ
ncbi:hypothetical protein [Burkholderia pyrrocinia]|uniref:hypothetical protein n=1 Tax=Burkholderia pyrrocinia TaxID=60550 RepID=UPI001BCEE0FA|nr:hypothetical protein [Burkholderia pyrrocinia]QVN22970.1 hypothetical protein JYG32_36605 [Burkholderia pyrrocinia]